MARPTDHAHERRARAAAMLPIRTPLIAAMGPAYAASALIAITLPASACVSASDVGGHRETLVTDDMANFVASPAKLCDFGSVVGNVFGRVVEFHGGRRLPPGRYRINYVDGCMKYSGSQGWAVHAHADDDPAGRDAFRVVGAGTGARIVTPPGTVGFLVGRGGFSNFEDCVAANRTLQPVEFDFAGGELGIWLEDEPYDDNIAGPGGRSPRWQLTAPGSCEDDRPAPL